MTLLNDKGIAKLAENDILMPYFGEKKRTLEDGIKAISFGLSQGGYDIRLSPDGFRIVDKITWRRGGDLDPKLFDEGKAYEGTLMHKAEGSFFLLPPFAYGLGVSVERFTMPNNVMGFVFGKSTYARCGLVANITPIEPGWSGFLTMCLVNTTSYPLRLYVNEGIAQVVFFDCGEVETPYSGNYQNQDATVKFSAI